MCNYATKNKSNFNRHNRTHSKDGNNNSTNSHYCDQCGKWYKSKFGLSLHIKNNHEQSFKHVCGICDKGYNQTVQYRFHCASHHKVCIDSCKFCKKRYSSHGSLRRHLQSCSSRSTDASTTQDYKCDICGESFARKYSLTYHIKGKHQEPKYKCNGCNRNFACRFDSCLTLQNSFFFSFDIVFLLYRFRSFRWISFSYFTDFVGFCFRFVSFRFVSQFTGTPILVPLKKKTFLILSFFRYGPSFFYVGALLRITAG